MANQRLTSAVGEAPVARGAHGAVSADDIGSAAALTAERVAGVALGADLVAGARHGAVVEEGRQRHGRAQAELGGGGGAEEEGGGEEVVLMHIQYSSLQRTMSRFSCCATDLM